MREENWIHLADALRGNLDSVVAIDDPSLLPGEDQDESAYLRVMRRKLDREINTHGMPLEQTEIGRRARNSTPDVGV